MPATSSQVRAATLAIILAMMPASSTFAQSHKGKQGSQQSSAGQHKAAPPQQAKVTPRRQPSPMGHPNGMVDNVNSTIKNPSNESLISDLQSTMTHLNQADRDYNGHKDQAIHELNTAITLLSTSTGRSNAGNPGLPRTGNGTGRRTPQSSSDAHLSDAQKSLVAIESQMNISGVHPYHFTRAKSSVQDAVRELNLALCDR
jgi:hypothetical protein